MKKAMVFLLVLMVVCVALGETRTWTSRSGQEITAKYVKSIGDSIVLEKEDGKQMKVKLSALSKADIEYVREMERKALLEDNTPRVEKPKLDWAYGSTTELIECKDAPQWSYHIYLPNSLNGGEKWPVMFVMSPGAGSKRVLDRYIEGAERVGWVLVVSKQSRNGFDGSHDAVKAMAKDVKERLPIDTAQMYSTGFSGGARMAFFLATHLIEDEFAGVLACGAGGLGANLSESAVLYGLCGSNCFNRWDMAVTFKQFQRKPNKLVFFRGNHDWAGAFEISEGMAWLHRSHLKVVLTPKQKKAATSRPKLTLPSQRDTQPKGDAINPVLEREGKRIFGDIVRYKESRPESALDWALYLTDFPCSSALKAEGKKLLDELRTVEKLKLYEQGLVEMQAFVEKHFATDVMAYQNNPNPPAARDEATALAAKYAGTSLQSVFEGMSQACVKP